jgi:hypothetical protein
MRRKLIILGVLAGWFSLVWCGCRQAVRPVAPAFYFWKTTFRLSKSERLYLDSLGCQRLFVKFLDVGKVGGEIRPLALLEVNDTAGLAGKVVTPCVFIANHVFEGIRADQSDFLATKTADAIQRIGRQFPAYGPEIQFDCDWTASTRTAYFSFLEKMKSRLPESFRLSATIRLHQYKFPKRTGVPPVARGMLMFYNTGDVDDQEEPNSIFRTEAVKKYLQGAPDRYPLPLDVVLPVFSWGLVYRNEELWKIIPELNRGALQDTSLFGSGEMFVVKRGTFLAGYYLRQDDRIRIESVSENELELAAKMAGSIRLGEDATVGFYHLDSVAMGGHPAGGIRLILKMVDGGR